MNPQDKNKVAMGLCVGTGGTLFVDRTLIAQIGEKEVRRLVNEKLDAVFVSRYIKRQSSAKPVPAIAGQEKQK